VSCPICGRPRGTNEYCWGHVNSDGTGYLLPHISMKQLIRYKPKPRKLDKSASQRATRVQSKLRGK